MPVNNGPVVMATVGDVFVQPARIMAVLWVGTTSVGDQAELRDPVTNAVLWPGLTDTTSTYLGASIGFHGIDARNGFKAARLDNGKLYVYLREG